VSTDGLILPTGAPAEVRSAASALTTGASDLETETSRFSTAVTTVLADWKGQASHAFETAASSVRSGLNDLAAQQHDAAGVLSTYASALGATQKAATLALLLVDGQSIVEDKVMAGANLAGIGTVGASLVGVNLGADWGRLPGPSALHLRRDRGGGRVSGPRRPRRGRDRGHGGGNAGVGPDRGPGRWCPRRAAHRGGEHRQSRGTAVPAAAPDGEYPRHEVAGPRCPSGTGRVVEVGGPSPTAAGAIGDPGHPGR
jgi:hypothetical protein